MSIKGLKGVKMPKISKKDLIERTISFALGSLVSFSLVYATTVLESTFVSYDNSSSGLNSETVQDAIDELYGMTGKCPKGYVCEKIPTLYDKIQSQAKTDTIDFSIRSGVSGTHGVYTTTETEGNVPVYYFRGDYDKINNNIIYNNMCWKIIRTTETGGVKLIYNGTPTNGQCLAQLETGRSGTLTNIGTSRFNSKGDNAYVGYMYGNLEKVRSSSPSALWMNSSSSYYYGTSYTFDENTKKYSLSGTLTSGVWSSSYVGMYTCRSTSSTGTCTELYYTTAYDSATQATVYTYTYNSTSYEKAHANINNSDIKTYIDNWFSTNFNSEAIEKLEDTVFCNDRSTVAGGNNNTLSSSFGTLGYEKNSTGYGALARASYWTIEPRPSLVCPQQNDKFTLKTTKTNYNEKLNGNKALDYPVGLITFDEVVLAGFNTYASNTSDYRDKTNYLYTGQEYWTLSPVSSGNGFAYVGLVDYSGCQGYSGSSSTYMVRPAVSLRDGTLVETGGDGTTSNPYVVK